MKKRIYCALLILFLSILIGCSSLDIKEVEEEISKIPTELNIYNWEDYLGETTVEEFEAATGIKVNLFIFEDESFMESDVQSNPSKYDLIVGSDSIIQEMIKLKLLAKIDYNNIPNYALIDTRYKNPYYDPYNQYSAPYMWGTTGIAINTKYIPEDSNSWEVMWNKEYTGKIAMLNNREEVIAASLKRLGYELKTADISKLEEAEEALIAQKEIIKGYLSSVDIRDQMVSEELWAGHIYSGEALGAMENNENLKYIIPEEGAIIWMDSFAIPIDAKNKKAAELFINFVLEPEINAEIVNYNWYASPLSAAEEFINPEILQDESVYPNKATMEKLEYLNPSREPEAVTEYNKIWSRLQYTE